ncbi:hypothetical protein PoMZ_13491 [Pyricularia oryzae]|uniref:FAD-binding PCMH-type domain-containing protein n=1 Tax=Pyricularia oryzae TaxID=318829 RepID=A0A4P7NVM3_PYROR|nr:hypothetical protein PoMZ_13491 [Pyricularia oryzae]
MVFGGRVYIVGVGGLFLNGNNSFYSIIRGFICNGVAEFEVILVNGNIINVNINENADLYRVLKGGLNNFGVVIRFDLNIFKTPATFWGNLIAFPFSGTKDANQIRRLFFGFIPRTKPPRTRNVTSALRTDTFAGFINKFELPQGNYNAWRTLIFKNNRDIITYAVKTYLNIIKKFEAKPSFGFTAQYIF